jgi:hypothetical protein
MKPGYYHVTTYVLLHFNATISYYRTSLQTLVNDLVKINQLFFSNISSNLWPKLKIENLRKFLYLT